MPSGVTLPQRSARCQSVSSRRSSTRWWWAIASATARWWARRVPRLKSSTPSCGQGLMRVTSAWSSTARRVSSSTFQPTSALTCEPASSHDHGRITSHGPISSMQRRPSTSTSRLRSPDTIRKPRWWTSGSSAPATSHSPGESCCTRVSASWRARWSCSSSSCSARSGSASTMLIIEGATLASYPDAPSSNLRRLLRVPRSRSEIRRRPPVERRRPARAFGRDDGDWVLELELPDVLRLEYQLEVEHADGGHGVDLRPGQPEARARRVRREVGARAAGLRAAGVAGGGRRAGALRRGDDPRPRAGREGRRPGLEPGGRRAGHAAADAAGQRRAGVRRAVLADALLRGDDRRRPAAAVPGRAAGAGRPQPVVFGLRRLRAGAGARHRAGAARRRSA